VSPTAVGPAAPGWPTSGGVVDADRLHLVSRNLDRTRIAEVDLDTGALVRQVSIGVGDGAWGLAVAPDGVYVGLFGARGASNLHRLVAGRTTPVAALAVDYIWDLAADQRPGADGRVYGVGSHPSLVFAYDPATRRAVDLGILTGQQRPRTCVVARGRLVVGGSDAGRAVLVDQRVDGPADRPTAGASVRDLLPAALATDDSVYCSAVADDGRIAVGTAGRHLATPAVAVIDPDGRVRPLVVRLPREALVDTVAWADGTVFATARPSGALYRLDVAARRLLRVAVPVPMSETRRLAVVGSGSASRVVGVSADGTTFAHERGSGRTTTTPATDLGLALRPQRAQSICATADRVDVGGSFSLTRHRPTAGQRTTRFVPGEPKAMVDVAGTLYLALYPIGEIWCWAAGDEVPRRLTQLDSDQLRPVALAWMGQLGALLCTTTDDRSRTVLHTIDPVTGRVDRIVDPLGRQALAGVTASGQTIFVGGSGAAPAVAAYDAVSGARAWIATDAVPDGGFVLGLQAVAGRLAVTTTRGWFTTVDIATGAVARPVRVAEAAGQLRRVGDHLLLATGDALLRLDPVTRTATTVQRGLGGEFWGWAPMDVDPSGRAWLLAGRDLAHT
jgi:hypothetical protein